MVNENFIRVDPNEAWNFLGNSVLQFRTFYKEHVFSFSTGQSIHKLSIQMAGEDEENQSVSSSKQSSAGQIRDTSEPTPAPMSYHRILAKYLESSTLLGLRSSGKRPLISLERYELLPIDEKLNESQWKKRRCFFVTDSFSGSCFHRLYAL